MEVTLGCEGFGVVGERLLYAPRGHRWTVEGIPFGEFGGAFSVNRASMELGKTWFEGEEITSEDLIPLGTDPLDVLLTHKVPVGIGVETDFPPPEHLERQAYAGRLLVRDAVLNTSPRLVLSGH